MQIVGLACATCRALLKSEAGAIGCERCELAFHIACLRSGVPTTYRDAFPKRPKGAPLLCPTCGDDLRALKKQRDTVRDALHAQAVIRHEAARSAQQTPRRRGVIFALWIAFALVVNVLRIVLGDP